MSFSEEAGKEIENCINVLLDLLRLAMTAVKEGSEEEAELVFKNKKKLHKAEKKFKAFAEKFREVTNGKQDEMILASPASSTTWTELPTTA